MTKRFKISIRSAGAWAALVALWFGFVLGLGPVLPHTIELETAAELLVLDGLEWDGEAFETDEDPGSDPPLAMGGMPRGITLSLPLTRHFRPRIGAEAILPLHLLDGFPLPRAPPIFS